MAIFISGGGSCLQTLLDVIEYQNIAIVISNKTFAKGLKKAQRFGVECFVLDQKINFLELSLWLQNKGVEKIFLAGFMKIIPTIFLKDWENKIFNIHPSLLPEFKGLHGFDQSFSAKADMGATIHHVSSDLDSGISILQKKSISYSENISKEDSELFLRLSEQHLLRQFILKGL